jgi:capsular exopolysaccharide synthesis family protein
VTSTFDDSGAAAHGRERRSSDFGSGRDLRNHLHAVTHFWKSVVGCVMVGVLVGALISARTTPVHEVKSTFFASSQNALETQAVQADEFAQRRINSYVGLVTSERIANLIKEVTQLDLTTREIQDKLSASVAPDTVLLNVRVADTDPERALVIGKALIENLDREIALIDTRESNTSVVLNAISGPTLTPYPVKPNTRLNIAVGLLLGLMLGLVQAVLRQQLDQSFRSREQLAEEAGYPVLGEILFEASARRNPVLTEDEQLSRRAESFRQLRTNLRFLGVASPVSALVVTSSTEGEGKSSTSANLALALAAAGRRVLLIDADLRRPAIGRYLDIEGAAGLTNVLVDHANAEDLVQYWGVGGLSVLASGPLPPNPSELLGSPAMDKLLLQMRDQYDITIIDTPPLGSVTDAAVVATKADGAILVVRYGNTRRDRVFHALDALENVDARILGTVLSMSKVGKKAESAYYYSSVQTG